MRRTRRSLVAESSCSDVTTCLSEGSTECTLASENCPPCVYALTGGDFSCYSRDTSGACPFSSAYAECDSSGSTKSSTSGGSNTESSNTGSSTSTTPTATTAPTTTKKPTTSDTDSSSPSTTTTGSNSDNEQTQESTPSPGLSKSQRSKSSTTNSSSNSGEAALTASTGETGDSPFGINMALIAGAVVLVVIVLVFVARRVAKRRRTRNHDGDFSTPSAYSDGTLATGATTDMYSTYSYKNEMGKGRFSGSGPVLLESRATNSFGPANSEVSNGLSPRSTADFSQFGGGTNYEDSQFGEDSQYIGGGDSQYVVGGKYGKDSQYSSKYGGDSQYFSEYSVSTGPEIAGPSRVTTNHHFVDINSMANTNTEVHKHSGEHPLTVSQLSTRQRAPMAIAEDEEEYHSGGRRPAPKYGSGRSNEGRRHQSPPPPPPYTDSIRQQAGFGVSTASSMRSDYDIVDPITMRDVEQRNTEMLMEDSRYPKFSFASDASDIYDDSRDSSEEEVDVHGLRHGERMI